jgi:hypothetical protein
VLAIPRPELTDRLGDHPGADFDDGSRVLGDGLKSAGQRGGANSPSRGGASGACATSGRTPAGLEDHAVGVDDVIALDGIGEHLLVAMLSGRRGAPRRRTVGDVAHGRLDFTLTTTDSETVVHAPIGATVSAANWVWYSSE